jgi:hypothetical protein
VRHVVPIADPMGTGIVHGISDRVCNPLPTVRTDHLPQDFDNLTFAQR